jgi:hypothetical protein
MGKLLAILLMFIFGISGIGAAALAWLLPWLNLDKTEAAVAGLLGTGFIIFQSLWLRHNGHDSAEAVSMNIQAEDNN